MKFGKFATFYLCQPGIEEFSGAVAQHLCKLLNQVTGQIHFRVDLPECADQLLLLDTQLFWVAKEQKSGLPWGRKRGSL